MSALRIHARLPDPGALFGDDGKASRFGTSSAVRPPSSRRLPESFRTALGLQIAAKPAGLATVRPRHKPWKDD